MNWHTKCAIFYNCPALTRPTGDKSCYQDRSPSQAGRYFPGLVQTKRDTYEKLAGEKLEQAKVKLAENDAAGARKLIATMVADGSDLPSVQAAAELVKESKPAKAVKK